MLLNESFLAQCRKILARRQPGNAKIILDSFYLRVRMAKQVIEEFVTVNFGRSFLIRSS